MVFINWKNHIKIIYKITEANKNFFYSDEYRKNLSLFTDRNYEQITYIRPFYSLSNGSIKGVVALSIDKYKLKKIIMGKQDSINMILDSKRKTIIDIIPEKFGYKELEINLIKKIIKDNSGDKICRIGNDEYFLIYDRSRYNEWIYVNLIPVKVLLIILLNLVCIQYYF